MSGKQQFTFLSDALRKDIVCELLLRNSPDLNQRSAELISMEDYRNRPTDVGDALYVGAGLLPSISVGKKQLSNYSRIFDSQGSYLHPQSVSELEVLLNDVGSSKGDRAVSQEERAKNCIQRINESRLSLLDHDFLQVSDVERLYVEGKDGGKILIFDQAIGDSFARSADLSAKDFNKMLRTARADNPNAEIYLSCARDEKGSPCNGYCDLDLAAELKVKLIDENFNWVALIECVDKVYVANSPAGFQAMLLGKPVYCFAQSFYGGWGLTQDSADIVYERRERQHSLESLFAGVYFSCSRYLNPVSLEPCELDELLDFLILQKRLYLSNAFDHLCIGFPPWKRAYIRRALYSPQGQVRFFGDAKKAQAFLQKSNLMLRQASEAMTTLKTPLRLVQWGEVASEEIAALSEQKNVPVLRMEDGFIRSVGLGKYYIPPVSLVADSSGIYYNAEHSSDLESLLKNKVFSADEINRATRLIQYLDESRISKYNVGAESLPYDIEQAIQVFKKSSLDSGSADHVSIALVVGQVADDVSVKLGGSKIKTDLELLEAVRQKRPSAFLIYKPHPDVVSGNVSKSDANVQDLAPAQALADLTVSEVDINVCIDAVDELHCNTSLAGFEAMLRNKIVYVYGRPFYAGWGLTMDSEKIERRSRAFSLPPLLLEELVHAALIDYPRYMDYEGGHYITIEQALLKIRQNVQSSHKTKAVYSTKIQRVIRKVRNLLGSLIYGLRF